MGEIWGLRTNRDKNCDILSNKRKNNVAFVTKKENFVCEVLLGFLLLICSLSFKEIRYLDGLLFYLARRRSRRIQ